MPGAFNWGPGTWSFDIVTLGNVCAVITLRDSGHDKGKIIPSCQTAPGSPCQKCLFNNKSRGHLIEKIWCQSSPIWTQYSPILPGERGQGHTIARVGGGGGGRIPYFTYTGVCRPTGSWFWSSWLRTWYPFQRHFLERGIKFRMYKSSSFVSSHLKLFKDRLLLTIQFNALTSKLLYSCCNLCFSMQGGRILAQATSADSTILNK